MSWQDWSPGLSIRYFGATQRVQTSGVGHTAPKEVRYLNIQGTRGQETAPNIKKFEPIDFQNSKLTVINEAFLAFSDAISFGDFNISHIAGWDTIVA
jgi:hypothetical protein